MTPNYRPTHERISAPGRYLRQFVSYPSVATAIRLIRAGDLAMKCPHCHALCSQGDSVCYSCRTPLPTSLGTLTMRPRRSIKRVRTWWAIRRITHATWAAARQRHRLRRPCSANWVRRIEYGRKNHHHWLRPGGMVGRSLCGAGQFEPAGI